MDFHLTAEQQALRQRARDLADGTFAGRAARWDESEEYPWDNVKDLVAGGFMGMTIPREHGGADRPILDVVLVIEEVARACGVTGRIVVEGSLGVVGALRAYGTEAQKRRYFLWVLEGDKPAIAITEPEAVSAATDMTTRAEPTSLGLPVSAHKRCISHAGTSRARAPAVRAVHRRFPGHSLEARRHEGEDRRREVDDPSGSGRRRTRVSRRAPGGQGQDAGGGDGTVGDQRSASDPRRRRLRPEFAARAHGARRPHVRDRRRHARDDAEPDRRPDLAD